MNQYTAHPIPFADRFWGHIDQSGGPDACWIWTAGRTVDGYGSVRTQKGCTDKASRVAWKLTHGPIPKGLSVLHRCDNPPCCNPDHLWLGTQRENIADRHAKRRDGAPRGEQHGQAKLTTELVREIRKRYAAGGVTHQQLATLLGVNKSTVGSILSGKAWRHV